MTVAWGKILSSIKLENGMPVFSDVIFLKRYSWLHMIHMIQVLWEMMRCQWISGSRVLMALSTNPATQCHLRRPEFSTTLLQKPQILHGTSCYTVE